MAIRIQHSAYILLSEAAVQQALSWNDRAWPWANYGPAIMAAVRAGVPVEDANLPRARMKEAMGNLELDTQLFRCGVGAPVEQVGGHRPGEQVGLLRHQPDPRPQDIGVEVALRDRKSVV